MHTSHKRRPRLLFFTHQHYILLFSVLYNTHSHHYRISAVTAAATQLLPYAHAGSLMIWYLPFETCSLTQWYLEREGVHGGAERFSQLTAFEQPIAGTARTQP